MDNNETLYEAGDGEAVNNQPEQASPDSWFVYSDNTKTTLTGLSDEGKKQSKIVIPKTVTNIGDEAFYACSEPTSISIPNTVTSIGNCAFNSCIELTNIKVDVDNKNYCDVDGVLFNKDKTRIIQYPNGKTGDSYNIPNTVTSIGDYAFADCNELTSIIIPNATTSIGDEAFFDCTGLTSISIPNTVTSIGDYAFRCCSELTNIKVDINNKNYCDVDGVLFNKDKTEIIQYPINKTGGTYNIPNTVTSIEANAFYGCSGLTSVSLPNAVTSIEDNAFFDCSKLTSIKVDINNKNYCDVDGVLFNKDKTEIIQYPINKICDTYTVPDTVTSIGDNAFYACPAMKVICTQELWDKFKDLFPDGSTMNKIEQPSPDSWFVYSDRTKTTLEGLSAEGKKQSKIVIPSTVTSIEDGAFYECTGITSISIPNSVTSIKINAFYGCSGLTNMSIPNSVTSIGYAAFCGCSGLTSISIPNTVTSIEDCTFTGCSGLTSISIPNTVTTIGDAFIACSGLTSISIPNTVTSIGDGAFDRCSGLTSIKVDVDNKNYCDVDGVLFNKDKTKIIQHPINKTGDSYNIPNTVTSIGNNAFSGCSGLTSISIPNTVTSIGYEAFSDCIGLTSISIPNTVTSIGEFAFDKCSGLISISIPDSVTSIGQQTFYKCSGLKSINIPNTVTSIGDGAFEGCSGLTSISIPNSVTSIGDGAFDGCIGLTSIIIPNTITSIVDHAFYNCSGLTSINIPDTVTSIGYFAFYGCPAMKVTCTQEQWDKFKDSFPDESTRVDPQ